MAAVSDFCALVSSGLYVDKSKLIISLAENPVRTVNFTRPSGYGKTTNLGMLAAFFDVRRNDGGKLFRGLAVMENKALVEEWMNKVPVVYLSFSAVLGGTFDEARSVFSSIMAELYRSYSFIISGFKKDDVNAERFRRLMEGRGNMNDLYHSIHMLTMLLEKYYGRQVVHLVDDYDVALANARQHGFYDEFADFMGALLSEALKDNRHVIRNVLTGCVRLPAGGSFSSLDNITEYPVSGSTYCDAFGFTESEVDRLLEKYGLEDQKATVKQRSGGCRIGKEDLYSPREVVACLEHSLGPSCSG